MKTYPTISREIVRQPIYAFDKLDGSNIRAEWSRKRGFYKFGSRGCLVGQDNPLLGKAQSLVETKYADDLNSIFRRQRWNKAVAFFEYYGPNSFAGVHEETDDHTVTLIDINYEKRGIMEPPRISKDIW